MKTKIIRIIAAGFAVFALAVGGSTVADHHTVEAKTADTGWG